MTLANDSLTAGNTPLSPLNTAYDLAYAPITHYYYIADPLDSAVLVVNPASGRLVTSIPVAGFPDALAYDPSNHNLYAASPGGVLSTGADAVEVINIVSNTVGTPISLGVNHDPIAIAYDPVTKYLYVGEFSTSSVAVVDPIAGSVVGRIPVGTTPNSIAFDSAGHRGFVANTGSDNVTEFNTTSFGIVRSISVGSQPWTVGFAPTSRTVWVANYNSTNLSIFDESTQKVSTIGLPHGSYPLGVAYDSGRNTVYITGVASAGVRIYNASTDTVTRDAGVVNPAGPVAYAADRGEVGLLCGGVTPEASTNLTLINDVAESPFRSVPTAPSMVGTVYDPTTGYVYVADSSPDHVYAVDERTDQVAATFPVPGPVSVLAPDPSGQNLFVGYSTSSNVSELNATTGATVQTLHFGFPGGVGGISFVGNQVYVSESSGTGVRVFDASTWSPITTIPVGSAPTQMVADPANNEVYVVNSASANLTVFRNTTNAVVGAVVLSGDAYHLAYDPIGSRIFVTIPSQSQVAMVNGGSLSTAVTFNITSPGSVAFANSTGSVYVSQTFGGQVDIINGSTVSLAGTIAAQEFELDLAYAVQSGQLFIAGPYTGSLSMAAIAPAAISPPFAAWALAFPSSVEVGQSMTFAVSSTLRPWQVTESYSSLPPGCTPSNGYRITCQPSAPGTFTVHIAVNGPASQSTTTQVTVTVHPRISIAIHAVPAAFTLGASTSISLSVANATGSVSVGWAQLPPACVSTAHATSFACAASVSGFLNLTAVAVDGAGAMAEANLSLTVNPRPTVAAFVSTSDSTDEGSEVWLNVTMSGGTAPFTFVYSGLPRGCTSVNASSLPCTPTQTGRFLILVNVTDSNGYSTQAELNLTVAQKSSSSTLLGLPILDWGLVAVVVVVLLVLVAVLAMRRRPTAASPSGPGPSPSPPAEESVYGGEGGPAPMEPAPVEPMASPAPEPPAPRPAPVSPAPVAPSAPPPPQVSVPVAAKVTSAPPASGPMAGSARAPLKCPKCGTMNEPWLTNCRWCKGPLATTNR